MPNEIAVTDPAFRQLAAPKPPTVFASTFDFEDKQGRIKAINAMGNATLPSAEVVGAGTLEITDFILHHADAVNDDGELVQYARCVIFLASGDSVAFSSVYVTKAIWSYHQLVQKGPWNPPLRMQIESQKRGVKTYYVATILGQ